MTQESDAFEQQVHRLHKLIEGADVDVTWNDRIPDPDNPKQPRQIDITIRRGDVLTIVECRLHKEPQDVTWIEELMGRRLSLQASSAIAVSASGFTDGAIKKAQAHGIFLRGFNEVTPSEIESWGCLIEMSVCYYQYENLELALLFEPESILKIDLATLTAELRVYPGRQSLFNAAAEQFESLKLLTLPKDQRKPVSFRIRMRLEGFRLCGQAVVELEFSGRARLVEEEIAFPGLIAYRNPANPGREQPVVIQKSAQGETAAMVYDAHRLGTVLDLSSLELPPNSQFQYCCVTGRREMDMDSFELLGVEHIYTTGGPMTIKVARFAD